MVNVKRQSNELYGGGSSLSLSKLNMIFNTVSSKMPETELQREIQDKGASPG